MTVRHPYLTNYKITFVMICTLFAIRIASSKINSDFDKCLDAFVDADLAADISDRKSTTGIIIRNFNNLIMWKSQKQKIVSSTHAEYYAIADCVEEFLPILGVLKEVKKPVNIYEDNTGAVSLAKNGRFCKNFKHIDISYHFVHDYEKEGIINVKKIDTGDHLADVLTKSLCKAKFERFRDLLCVK